MDELFAVEISSSVDQFCSYFYNISEFGHNWGSEHDPDSAQCAPSSFDNGKFIMYTYSVSGYEANNKVGAP